MQEKIDAKNTADNGINWFPGHMAKAMRMMEESVKLCDGLIFVLDARAAFACLNDKITDLSNNKPVLYLLNKSDMVERDDVNKILSFFKCEGKNVLPVTGTLAKDGKAIYKSIIDIFNDKIQSKKQRGIKFTPRIMVCGLPNTGKSTVINTLCGKKQAQTGNKAGVTRGKQWIKIENLELLDTPGTTPPKFANKKYAEHLAYIGSINDDILDFEALLIEFISEIKENNKGVLNMRYGADESLSPMEICKQICAKRAFVSRGGEYDFSRCSKAVFDDFRKLRLGKICLETQPIK